MRYHVVVFKVLNPHDPPEAEVAFIDEEFEFSESSHKVTDVVCAAIDQLKAEGGPQ